MEEPPEGMRAMSVAMLGRGAGRENPSPAQRNFAPPRKLSVNRRQLFLDEGDEGADTRR